MNSFWIKDEEESAKHIEPIYYCANCGCYAWGEEELTNFCPNCGMNMSDTEGDRSMDWISVKDKQPSKVEKRYWVCTDGGYQCQCRWTNDKYGFGASDDWGWKPIDIPQYSKVVAWMPLPKPYKERVMGEFEKYVRSNFKDIWHCEIDHPKYQDTVGELMEEVIQHYHNLQSTQKDNAKKEMRYTE